MSSTALLRARIAVLRDEVEEADRLVKRVTPELDGVAPPFLSRTMDRFEHVLASRRADVLALEQDALDVEDGAWRRLDELEPECTFAFRECLAFFSGALLRSHGIDGGMCSLADQLLETVGRRAGVDWKGLTILGESEFFDGMAGIVRIRFPELTIWHLPIAVHEFGHFAAPKMGLDPYTRLRLREAVGMDGSAEPDNGAPSDTYPVQEILVREWKRGRQIRWSYVYELFADMFAAYAVGPAYAYTCVYLRLDPYEARRALAHPRSTERLYCILGTLRRADREAGLGTSFEPHLDRLQAAWSAAAPANGCSGELADSDRARLDEITDELYARLTERPPKLRYSGFPRAMALAGRLSDDPPGATVDADRDTVLEVLNGAWVAAARQWENRPRVAEIGRQARALCQQLLDAPHAQNEAES